jgi:hypothetical protein
MIRLSDYIDFITSLVEMDEVKEGRFILPKSLSFKLELINHRELHKEVLRAKEQEIDKDILQEPFEVDVLGITLIFDNE